jgi:lipid kinase YegS
MSRENGKKHSIRILLNGKAAASMELRESVQALRDKGVGVEVRVTWEKGDAIRLVREAAAEDVRRIVAAGGDGTLHEIVNGLMALPPSQRPELAILPMGTANDFARSCTLPLVIDEALRLAVEGTVVPVDVGSVNEHYFLNVASSGFGAEVTAATPPELKRFLGGASYALMGLVLSLNLQPHDGEVTLPGDRRVSGDAILVGAVGNGRQAGGGVSLTPKAYIDDGLLDLLFIRQFPVTDLGTVIQELSVLPADGHYVGYLQSPWFEFDHHHPITVNLDGESYSFKQGRAEVVPAALRLVLPPECPLLVRNRPIPGRETRAGL